MSYYPSSDTLFRPVPMTGVIYVTTKATEKGFYYGSSAWANLGQGAPETGPLQGETPHQDLIISHDNDEYAPVAGVYKLRQRIADLYNRLYRFDKSSQYTAENVAICSGGRLALTRIAAALGNIHVGHCIPDYTAYEELLTTFKSFTPIPLLLSEHEDFFLSADALEQRIRGLGLSAILISNPCNPTGQHVRGNALRDWIQRAKRNHCTLIFDEFYSHYIYGDPQNDADHTLVSAARYIDDIENDTTIIVDGLTKNWRRPGWRISWTLGPKSVIEAITSAGSFLDGGAPHPLQHAALSLLEPSSVIENAKHLQSVFQKKRDFVLQQLDLMNIQVPVIPQGAFYCFANLEHLPVELRDGMAFFEAGLTKNVITVPGEFFDVNPGKRRQTAAYKQFSRISFGPEMETLEMGMHALQSLLDE